MAVPKRRTAHSRQGKRRSHLHLTPKQIQYCPQCNEPVLPHHVCTKCGQYQARIVVEPEEENDTMQTALDTMGGGHAPGPVVAGALQAVPADPYLRVTLFGDKAQIEPP